jgi:hypothetical protein
MSQFFRGLALHNPTSVHSLAAILLVTSAVDMATLKYTYIYFIYSLFNDAFSISNYIASNERMIVNNELERM